MNSNKQNLINKIIYRSQYRGTKEMDIFVSGFVKSIIDSLSFDDLVDLDKLVNMNDEDIIKKVLDIDFNQSLAKCGKNIKTMFLDSYSNHDFNLEKLNIGVSQLGKYNKFKLEYKIYSSFIELEDALDCCIASSHIPFLIGGGIFKKYKKIVFF